MTTGSQPVPTIQLSQAGHEFDQLRLSSRLLAKSWQHYAQLYPLRGFQPQLCHWMPLD